MSQSQEIVLGITLAAVLGGYVMAIYWYLNRDTGKKSGNSNKKSDSSNNESDSDNNESDSDNNKSLTQFIGSYQLVETLNYQQFLEDLGHDAAIVEASRASNPMMKVSEKDGVWTIRTSTTEKEYKITFRLTIYHIYFSLLL